MSSGDRHGDECRMKIEIAPAQTGDLPAIMSVYNDAVLNSVSTFDTEPFNEERQQEWFRRHGPRHPVFVARAEGRILGWASLNVFHERCAYENTVEDSVYVRAEYQRLGLGKMLLARLIAEARALGHHSIVARIADHSPASIALHRSLGFEKAGELRQAGFKFGRWIDVVLMQFLLE